MSNVRAAAVGDHASTIIFRAAGLDTRTADNARDAENVITSLIKDGFELIFLAENLAEELEGFLAAYRKTAYPLILPVPSSNGASGYGMKKLTANMEKAIGTNIFEKH